MARQKVPKSEQHKAISITLPPHLIELLDRLSLASGITRSAFFRQSIEASQDMILEMIRASQEAMKSQQEAQKVIENYETTMRNALKNQLKKAEEQIDLIEELSHEKQPKNKPKPAKQKRPTVPKSSSLRKVQNRKSSTGL